MSSAENTALFVGTAEVSDRQRFDVPALQDWMARHVDGFAGPLSVQQFRGGQSNPTFKLETPSRSYVMRAKPGPVARLLPSAHAIEREYRVLSALAKTDVPVGQVHALCEDESVIGRAFYLMEFVSGRVLWEQSLPDMTRSQRHAIYDEMNRVIAALHSVDPVAVGLADFGKFGSYIARQVGRWTKQYQASETDRIPEMDRLIDWLPQHIPAGDETTIVHGDYRLDNLIFHPTEPRILAVLDWELSTLGHPLADFAYHCMGYHIAPEQFRGIRGLDLDALGIPSEQQYIDLYCQRTGRTGIDNWNFYMAYNCFRLAAIVQGIMKRAVDGTASSPQAFEAGRRARPLAELAWSFAEKV
jgi:aminoglycoside phosphotransferase (APT) family kinase protein